VCSSDLEAWPAAQEMAELADEIPDDRKMPERWMLHGDHLAVGVLVFPLIRLLEAKIFLRSETHAQIVISLPASAVI